MSETRNLKRPVDFTEFAKDVHEENHKWYYDASGNAVPINIKEKLMLAVSEISECMEAERYENKFDKYLTHRLAAEIELADAVIRLLDFAGFKKYDISVLNNEAINIEKYSQQIPENKAECLLAITTIICDVHYSQSTPPKESLEHAIFSIEIYCERFGYDLWGAVFEKLEYNKTRPDHSYEERAKDGGKKF